MRYLNISVFISIYFWFSSAFSATAASMSVMPIKLDLTAPKVADKLIVANGDDEPFNIQVRLFRWSTVNGVDRLDPTTDVVASPPAAHVPAHGQYVVRVVRTAKTPVVGEERYRVLIDQIPEPKKLKKGTIGFSLRFSVPVFFQDANASDASVTWTGRQTVNGLVISGVNSGDLTMRISDMQVLSGGRVVASKKGLVGYVQGGATATFPLGPVKGALQGAVQMKAQSDGGVVDVTVPISN